jgi:hypothetical protein
VWLFITGEFCVSPSKKRRVPVLRVNLHSEEVELKDAGTWMTNPDGNWQRCVD